MYGEEQGSLSLGLQSLLPLMLPVKAMRMVTHLYHCVELDHVFSTTCSESHRGLSCSISCVDCVIGCAVIRTPAAITIIKPFPCVTLTLKERFHQPHTNLFGGSIALNKSCYIILSGVVAVTRDYNQYRLTNSLLASAFLQAVVAAFSHRSMMSMIEASHCGVLAVPARRRPGKQAFNRFSIAFTKLLSCSRLMNGASSSLMSRVSRCIREASRTLRSFLLKKAIASSGVVHGALVASAHSSLVDI